MKRIVFPENWQTDQWYGFTRHHLEFEGCKAWIVEPDYPAGDGRWSWCTVWPEAFVKRVGIVDLLNHGFYHVHIDAFAFRASPEGVRIMSKFQDFLVSMGLSPKANLIGMSWGGYFSLRYAEENPNRIAAIYLDAPLCNAADPEDKVGDRNQAISDNYKLTTEELKSSKLNPINNVAPIVEARIPLMAAVGEDDIVVNIDSNFNILEKRIIELGGTIKTIRRGAWGHHPHGLDDTEQLLKFHCSALEQ
ncbi:MAG: alpha/beta fold hydrolase [Lentisphaeria bacterium]|nr:alpha/beta fold hydrolase [Lentisphaeria bacterium]